MTTLAIPSYVINDCTYDVLAYDLDAYATHDAALRRIVTGLLLKTSTVRIRWQTRLPSAESVGIQLPYLKRIHGKPLKQASTPVVIRPGWGRH